MENEKNNLKSPLFVASPSPCQPVIRLTDVSKSFGERKILSGVCLALSRNELVSVLGISGSGKTTVFHLIAGMIPPDRGSIETCGKIGYMMQKDLLMPWKTVMENIALPLILQGKKKEEATRIVSSHLPHFGLTGTCDLYPDALSGGMRQRAALLRTYLLSGNVLLLDEPFSSVDAITRHQLHRWLLEIRKELSLSILLITHDVEEALILSDRIYVLAGSPAGIVEEIRLTDPTRTGIDHHRQKHQTARERIYEILESET
jgi:ABC-type nitrate/sulfonate/bicarbonate transport system ATPase subunit